MNNTDRFERLLQERRVALLERVAAVGADFARGRSGDSEDQAIERENEDALNAIDGEARLELTQIDRALEKIRLGTYGRCDGCGAAIGDDRLQVLPHAAHCMNCAQGEPHAH